MPKEQFRCSQCSALYFTVEAFLNHMFSAHREYMLGLLKKWDDVEKRRRLRRLNMTLVPPTMTYSGLKFSFNVR